MPDDVDFSECGEDQYRSIEGRFYQAPGQVEDIWILDLDGTRTYLFTWYLPGTPAETQSQLEQMVDSMEIEPVG